MQLSHCYFKMYGHKSQFVIGAGSSAAGLYVRIGERKRRIRPIVRILLVEVRGGVEPP